MVSGLKGQRSRSGLWLGLTTIRRGFELYECLLLVSLKFTYSWATVAWITITWTNFTCFRTNFYYFSGRRSRMCTLYTWWRQMTNFLTYFYDFERILRLEKNSRILTSFIMGINVRNNYGQLTSLFESFLYNLVHSIVIDKIQTTNWVGHCCSLRCHLRRSISKSLKSDCRTEYARYYTSVLLYVL